MHGNLENIICTKCKKKINIGYSNFNTTEFICECGNTKAKPDVVFFGEHSLNSHFFKREVNDLSNGDYLIVIGTKGNVVNIQTYITYLKNNNTNLKTILVNLEKSDSFIENTFDYIFYHQFLAVKPRTLGRGYKAIKNYYIIFDILIKKI